MDDPLKALPGRDYASASEAMRILNVRAQTLYAYVSRGWIHSIPQSGKKDRLYLRADIDRVGARALARSGHGAVAASAMNWGEPIFSTSVTEITAAGPRYRSHLAADLVCSGASFESVAELLWTGDMPSSARVWPVVRPGPELDILTQTLSSLPVRSNILEAFGLVVLVLGMRRGSVAQRLSRGKTLPAAREVMQTVVACCGLIGAERKFRPMRKRESIVDALMQSLTLACTMENREALRAMLILLADHELPPGTLAARVVASAGGTLHSCLASALCATSGVDVGRMFDRIEDFLGHRRTTATLVRRASQLHALGQSVPGFGHPLYPKGDPRAAQLLELARARTGQSSAVRAVFRFIDHMRATAGLLPRQELAVVVLRRAMALPPEAPAALFALARLAGWVAHVQEQRSAGTLLRPRARFVPA